MNSKYIQNACEEIDAAVFSGDFLLNNQNRGALLEYAKKMDQSN